jgi:hypothetical protein
MGRTIQLDPSVAAEAKGIPIPEGTYNVLIESAEEKGSKSEANKGKPVYHLRLRITDDGPAKNRSLMTYVSVFPDKNGNVIGLLQMLAALGLPISDDGTLDVPEPEELQGQTAVVKVTHEPFQRAANEEPEMRARVDRWIKAAASTGGAAKRSGKVGFGAKR